MAKARFLDDIRAAEKQNLKKFLLDLVDYCLKAVGLQWPTPDDDGLHQRELFKTFMGDTILRHRNAYDEQYRGHIRRSQPLKDISEFVSRYLKVHFESNSQTESHVLFFGFCAFLVDTAVFCCRYQRPDLVPHALEAAAQVHDFSLNQYREENLWQDFRSLVEAMSKCYEHPPKVPKFELSGEDCLSTSLSDSSHSETEDLVVCLERRRTELLQNANPNSSSG